MSKLKFNVLRPFRAGGENHSAGSIFETNDPELVHVLLTSGKAEPADQLTRKRIIEKPMQEWRDIPADRQHAPLVHRLV